MILKFEISGFSSFAHKQSLFFTPYIKSKLKNTKFEENFYFLKKNKVMKSGIILGPNASGKTNLILGIEKLTNLILYGTSSFIQNKDLLKFNTYSENISMEISILAIDNYTYTYKVVYNKEFKIIEEYLYKNNSLVYEFKNDYLTFGQESDKKIILSRLLSIPSSETILHKLKDFDLKPINIFSKSIKNITVLKDSFFPEIENFNILEFQKNFLMEHKMKALDILKTLDYTINNLEFDEVDEGIFKIYITRVNSNHKFFIEKESKGLKKITILLIYLLEIYLGKTVIIDEIDSSICSKSLIKIFKDFINTSSNKNGQLIGTCHNLFLCNDFVFNPQQIFIIDKDKDLSSRITCLKDFSLKNEKIYLNYLNGKYEN